VINALTAKKQRPVNNMVYRRKISAEQQAKVWFLKENTTFSLRQIAQKCEIAKSSVARICDTSRKRGLQTNIPSRKMGRPRKISDRDGRAVIRALESLRARGVNVTVKNVVKESGCSFQVTHRRKFSRFLNEKGYGYFVATRKGVLCEKDRKKRLKNARQMKRELASNPEFFQKLRSI